LFCFVLFCFFGGPPPFGASPFRGLPHKKRARPRKTKTLFKGPAGPRGPSLPPDPLFPHSFTFRLQLDYRLPKART
jgi:hypothetical protein